MHLLHAIVSDLKTLTQDAVYGTVTIQDRKAGEIGVPDGLIGMWLACDRIARLA
jgi:hypothetical protein